MKNRPFPAKIMERIISFCKVRIPHLLKTLPIQTVTLFLDI